jgi:hypothetical protein
MNRTIFVKREYLPIVVESAHLSAAVRSGSFVSKHKTSFAGGISLSGEILDLLLVRLRS